MVEMYVGVLADKQAENSLDVYSTFLITIKMCEGLEGVLKTKKRLSNKISMEKRRATRRIQILKPQNFICKACRRKSVRECSEQHRAWCT